ncbi:protein lin-52 homolog isoform X5 [Mycteria americana]|uniref:protein lin-52 homolog isoform X5 n=1 Tax=Mycteria americana TaxID=33587 RepID=UPI003F583312
MAAPADGADLEASLLSFEKLDRASPDLWPEQLPGVAEFAASFKSPITSSPPKWMAELENDDIDMLKVISKRTSRCPWQADFSKQALQELLEAV